MHKIPFRVFSSRYLDDLLSQGLIYCDPSRELNFWRPTQSSLLALGFRSHTDIPVLKELEEWFDTEKEFRATAELDPFFEKTGKLASRRLKRELQRRGTLVGEPCVLEPDPSVKRIPIEVSKRQKWADLAAQKYFAEDKGRGEPMHVRSWMKAVPEDVIIRIGHWVGRAYLV